MPSWGVTVSEHLGSSSDPPIGSNRRRGVTVSAVASPMLKLDPFFLSKVGIFRSRVHTLFRVLTSFYQRERGSTLRGKWIISFQIGRGRWRIYRMRRLVLPFKWKIGGRRWRIYRVRRLGLPFKWTYFPNTGPRECLSTLNSRQGMEGRMLSLGSLSVNTC